MHEKVLFFDQIEFDQKRGIVIDYDRFFFVPILQREGQSESVS